jgi:hypothetical protein
VFEIIRHGARAPLIPDPHFKVVETGMLSPQGMR